MNEAIKEILIKLLNNEEVRTLIKGILLELVLEDITIAATKNEEKKLLMTSEVCKMLSISGMTLYKRQRKAK